MNTENQKEAARLKRAQRHAQLELNEVRHQMIQSRNILMDLMGADSVKNNQEGQFWLAKTEYFQKCASALATFVYRTSRKIDRLEGRHDER